MRLSDFHERRAQAACCAGTNGLAALGSTLYESLLHKWCQLSFIVIYCHCLPTATLWGTNISPNLLLYLRLGPTSWYEGGLNGVPHGTHRIPSPYQTRYNRGTDEWASNQHDYSNPELHTQLPTWWIWWQSSSVRLAMCGWELWSLKPN